MRTSLLLATTLLTAASLAGCHRDDNFNTITSYMTLHNTSVSVHAPGRPDADISATGDLTIAGKPVAVTGTERDLLKHYYTTAVAIRDHGIATGKAGMATAGRAISSVASGLASGNPDKIDAEVNASAAKVEASVALICADLSDIRATQDTLASELEAFRPYALIKANEADDCRTQVHYR